MLAPSTMFEVIYIILIGLDWAIAATINGQFQSKIDLPRLLASPGPFGLRTWWARWKWYNHGHDEVIRAYEKVCRSTDVRRLTSFPLIFDNLSSNNNETDP
jgi:hypothetical protein